MVNVVGQRYGKKRCSQAPLNKKDSVDAETLCQQHASAHNTAAVFDTTKLNPGKGTPGRSATEGDGGSVANIRGVKRKRAALSGSGANDGVRARHSVCASSGLVERTPSLSGRPRLLLEHPTSRADDEVSLRAVARAGMKVELAVPSPAHGGDGTRMFHKQASPSSGWSSERGSSGVIGSDDSGTGWACGLLATVPGCLGTFDDETVGKVDEALNVKLELGVSSPIRGTSSTR
ncbi:unnamed protein product [Sphacelaria rigidula]